jgi:2'-5' RNA ligase superfamily
MLRTGLIVEVPDSEHVVAHWREQLDPHAMLGVPAHVTVLFPFAAPDRIDKGILTALRQVLSAVEPFEFRLPRTGWFGESVLWLAPQPEAPFRHLTEVLTTAFPDYPALGAPRVRPPSLRNPLPGRAMITGRSRSVSVVDHQTGSISLDRNRSG